MYRLYEQYSRFDIMVDIFKICGSNDGMQICGRGTHDITIVTNTKKQYPLRCCFDAPLIPRKIGTFVVSNYNIYVNRLCIHDGPSLPLNTHPPRHRYSTSLAPSFCYYFLLLFSPPDEEEIHQLLHSLGVVPRSHRTGSRDGHRRRPPRVPRPQRRHGPRNRPRLPPPPGQNGQGTRGRRLGEIPAGPRPLLLAVQSQIQPGAVRQYDHPEHRPARPDGQGSEHLRHADPGVVLLALSGAQGAREGQLHVCARRRVRAGPHHPHLRGRRRKSEGTARNCGGPGHVGCRRGRRQDVHGHGLLADRHGQYREFHAAHDQAGGISQGTDRVPVR
mmetsp:Transcript_38628/g.75350  ORF Transcript_38628/g.75350 Transcript_38628/m.75350 type:complete len:331 (-) Transcript_38628:459-1451(-)